MLVKTKNLIKKAWGELSRKDIASIVISLVILSLLFFAYRIFGDRLNHYIWTFDGVMIIAFVYLIMFIAGFSVMKALFFIAAELSLLIFLTQSYCNLSVKPDGTKEALQSLLIIGLSYIIYNFIKSLLGACKNRYKIIKNDRGWFFKTISISLFIFFAGVFIWQIFLVVNPIISDLCIYK